MNEDEKPCRQRTLLHDDNNNIKMSISIKTSVGDIDLSPMTLEFNAPLVGTEPTIGDLWASQISQEIKKAVASVFESKYGRRRTMGYVGSYADAQKGNSGIPNIADEKAYPSYEKMSKSWQADKKSADASASLTALIVDDGAMCRKVCGMMMQEMGFTVEFAEDGKEAVDKILAGDGVVNYYDVVMMDNFMPNMDGSDAVTLLRLNGYNGAIIGLTYDLFDDSSKQFKESGCTALLAKPLRAPLLKKTLTKIGISFIDNDASA